MTTPQHVTTREHTRQRKGKPCKHCGQPIAVGETFLIADYNTGFRFGTIGCFHATCWPLFLPNLGEHLKSWH